MKPTKKACIIDVQCPFDHDADALFIARKAKIDKYQCVADELRSKVFRAYVGAVTIGSLGCFDDDNLRSFAELGIQRKQGIALGKKLVSQTISHSRVIYNDHIHYKSSHPPPNTSISPNLRSLDTPATEPPHHPQQDIDRNKIPRPLPNPPTTTTGHSQDGNKTRPPPRLVSYNYKLPIIIPHTVGNSTLCLPQNPSTHSWYHLSKRSAQSANLASSPTTSVKHLLRHQPYLQVPLLQQRMEPTQASTRIPEETSSNRLG